MRSFVHAAGSGLIARSLREAVDVTVVLDKAGIRVQWGGASGVLKRREAACLSTRKACSQTAAANTGFIEARSARVKTHALNRAAAGECNLIST